MEKAYCEMNPTELREVIQKKKFKWKKAEERVDKYGTLGCIGQANKYFQDYVDLLCIGYNEEIIELTKEEFDICLLCGKYFKGRNKKVDIA